MTESGYDTRGLFITGTDTGVGKTHVTTLIARDARAAGVVVGAYKPVCSGSAPGPDGTPRWQDVDQLTAALAADVDPVRVCPQCFHPALAPPAAAREEGRHVDSRLLRTAAEWWRSRVELLLVEGAGGLLCPVTEDETVADLAADLGYPLVIVARSGLGTINHTLLTIEVARNRGLPVAGVVLNEAVAADRDPSARSNPDEITRRGSVVILGEVRHGQTAWNGSAKPPAAVDWLALAGRCLP